MCKEFTNPGIRRLIHDIIWCLGNHNGLQEDTGERGMGIGLYPVQSFINFYLNDLDRELSAVKYLKNFRYCDNILLISTSKKALEQGAKIIIHWADNILCQPIHTNFGMQTVDNKHPINFVGYKIYPNKTLVRNATKYNFIRKVKQHKENKLKHTLASYKGWLSCSNSLGLWHKVTHMNFYQGFNPKPIKKK